MSGSGSTANLPPEVQAQIAAVNHILNVSQIFYAAILTLTLWDWLLHIPEERRLIWKAKWSVGKVLYLMTRYITVILAGVFVTYGVYADLTFATCEKFVIFDALLAVLVTMCCEGVLFLRAYSIWNRNIWVLSWLSIQYIATFVILLVSVAKYVVPVPIPGGVGPCLPTGSGFFSSWWIVVLAFEVIATALITVKSALLLRHDLSGNGFLSQFMRDGVIYAFVVCVLNIINIGFVLQSANPLLRGINAPTTTYLTSVACCHLMLSLRRSGTNNDTYSQDSASRKSFGRPQRSNSQVVPINLGHARFGSASTGATVFDTPYEEKTMTGIRIDTEVAVEHSEPVPVLNHPYAK